jgi:hypothetical protein
MVNPDRAMFAVNAREMLRLVKVLRTAAEDLPSHRRRPSPLLATGWPGIIGAAAANVWPTGVTVDHPGKVGGSDTWEDSESWQHRRSTPLSCVSVILSFASAGAMTCGVPSWTVSPAGHSRPDFGCFTPSDRYLIGSVPTADRRVRGRAGGGAGAICLLAQSADVAADVGLGIEPRS